MEPPAHTPHDAVNVLDSWKQLTSGAKHWKNCMAGSVENMCGLLRAFGVEPSCTICKGTYLAFDTHTTSQTHFQVVYELVEKFGELARERLWIETCIVGGQVRYNYLDGELQVMRDVPLPLEPVTFPQQLCQGSGSSSVWLLLCLCSRVVTEPSGRICGVPPRGGKNKWIQLHTSLSPYSRPTVSTAIVGSAMNSI
jgi:hypothetical protein